ncbi:hypothetical protein QBC40DRAFT_281988 [Triangularia verruculosa]|uniref:RNA polymerase II subunit B1 CTD phosphatase RPAP2 homolog n=1 Tax=Triangularia verruculosa TaxID=2587418 RepID=A0AAN6XFU0_9PEZI|nr:hypothetical protein QBC40DRAFT_281988 [Triangularia verruculosa]
MAASPPPNAPPKSILKKTNPPPDVPSALELTGLTRAQAAQLLTLSKKELKPPIPIETFELLSASFPSSTPPSPDDVSLLLSHLPEFSPSEYLDLIDERNCLNHCGYALCSKPRRNFPGKVKIRPSGVAKTADLNKWCSDDCALKGMYIHVQLEHPSYEWVGDKGEMKVKIRLREGKDKEKEKGSADELEKAVAGLSLDGANDDSDKKGDDAYQKKQQAGRLAVERNGMNVDRVEVRIGEKEITQLPTAPTFSNAQGGESDAHLMVEGYKIGSKGKKAKNTEGESEDDDDDDFIPSIRVESLNYGKS